MRTCASIVPTLLVASALTLSGCSTLGFGKKGAADGSASGTLSEADLNAQREGRFGSGGIPSAEGGGPFRDIRFDYDSSAINALAREDIVFNAEVLRQNPGLSLQLEGHTDERGTAEYNMALGAARARAVQEVLASLGVGDSKIDTISYGEEVPLDPNPSEDGWAKNRRVHFSGFGR
jgi:peptidoglycan-associated lipoprotein